jgi:hypothetical protein
MVTKNSLKKEKRKRERKKKSKQKKKEREKQKRKKKKTLSIERVKKEKKFIRNNQKISQEGLYLMGGELYIDNHGNKGFPEKQSVDGLILLGNHDLSCFGTGMRG